MHEGQIQRRAVLCTWLGVGVDEGKAVGTYQQACDAGHVEAMVAVGHQYDTGRDVLRDVSKVISLYCKGKETGILQATRHLSTAFPKDSETTGRWRLNRRRTPRTPTRHATSVMDMKEVVALIRPCGRLSRNTGRKANRETTRRGATLRCAM